MTVHRFAPTLPLPTYLVAMMAGPFVSQQGMVAPTRSAPNRCPCGSSRRKPNAGKLAFALKGSEEIVRLLEAYFGDRFPFPKLDQITSPVMPGAMENAGADLYRDGLLVMDDDASTGKQRAIRDGRLA